MTYNREEQLKKLIGAMPKKLADTTIKGRIYIARQIAQFLKGEMKRGEQGHYSYEQQRHVTLREALQHELVEIKVAKRGEWYRPYAENVVAMRTMDAHVRAQADTMTAMRQALFG